MRSVMRVCVEMRHLQSARAMVLDGGEQLYVHDELRNASILTREAMHLGLFSALDLDALLVGSTFAMGEGGRLRIVLLPANVDRFHRIVMSSFNAQATRNDKEGKIVGTFVDAVSSVAAEYGLLCVIERRQVDSVGHLHPGVAAYERLRGLVGRLDLRFHKSLVMSRGEAGPEWVAERLRIIRKMVRWIRTQELREELRDEPDGFFEPGSAGDAGDDGSDDQADQDASDDQSDRDAA